MSLTLRGHPIVIALAWALAWTMEANPAPPQVPSLPTQTAGYRAYAIDNLPAHYSEGEVANTNNASPENPLTDAGATLGRVLFYDKRLSHNNGVSCATCHRQANGFSDPNPLSQGVNGQTTRHSMALSNITYYDNGKSFWDERAATLEEQALQPIENAVEMGSTLGEVVAKLNQTAFYPALFQAAFGTPEVTPERIGKAIAQFERSMVSYNAKYDSAFAPGSTIPNFAAVFTQQELNGRLIFATSGLGTGGRCIQCHTTSAHVSDAVHNVGLPGSIDPGAGNGQFKAPSLRNIEVRGAYMHDGRFTTLDQVAQFYNNGVQFTADLDPILMNAAHTDAARLGLDATERADLVAYLKTLTDNTFLTSPLFSDPFATLPGDYTGDGIVDAGDFNAAKDNYGDTSSLQADGNGDLVVDAADYIVWRKFVGLTWLDLAIPPDPSSSRGIPEPAGIALATIVFAREFTTRRRVRKSTPVRPRPGVHRMSL